MERTNFIEYAHISGAQVESLVSDLRDHRFNPRVRSCSSDFPHEYTIYTAADQMLGDIMRLEGTSDTYKVRVYAESLAGANVLELRRLESVLNEWTPSRSVAAEPSRVRPLATETVAQL